MMKLRKGESLVENKFAASNKQREFKFGGVIEVDGKSFLSTTFGTRREAIQTLEKEAKKLKGALNLKTVQAL